MSEEKEKEKKKNAALNVGPCQVKRVRHQPIGTLVPFWLRSVEC